MPNFDQDYNDGILCVEGQYEIRRFYKKYALSLLNPKPTLVFRDGGYNVNSIDLENIEARLIMPSYRNNI